MDFEVGQYWNSRDGGIRKIVEVGRSGNYPIVAQHIRGHGIGRDTFSADGHYQVSNPSHGWDLVSRYDGPTDFPEPQARISGNDLLDIMRQQMEQVHALRSDAFSGSFTVSMGEPEKPRAEEKAAPQVTWDDVIGLEDAKTALQEAIEAPYLYGDVYQHFNLKPPKGVLLYGPPGCGKTMLGKAAASAMARVHNKPFREGFFYYSCGDMLGPGWSDEAYFIKNAFKKAEQFKREHGYPAILFFDECDIMLPDRKTTNYFVKNAVNIFLSKMDGMDAVNCFIILATNNHHELDEAAIRSGRIDKKIFVGRPDKKAAQAIVTSYLLKKPLAKFCPIDELVERAIGSLYSESLVVKERELFHYMNGAMLCGLVETAGAMAFRKALRDKQKEGFQIEDCGIGFEEIDLAVKACHKEVLDMKNHEPEGIDTDLKKEMLRGMKNANSRMEGEGVDLEGI